MKRLFNALIGAVIILISAGAAEGASIWPSTATPTVADSGPDNPVELGVRFLSSSAGTITGIRFYKATANTGTHIGNLWSATGTLLATATFSNETASGWQEVDFSTPVSIAANTVYIASYHTNAAHYSDDENYFAGGLDSGVLHVPADGANGPNCVYSYGSASSFPTLGWNASNYWVDVAFTSAGGGGADTTPPTVTSFSVPAAASTLTVPILSFTATDNVAVAGYLVSESPAVPAPADPGWLTSAPASYLCGSAGTKTLYAFAKDAAGNVSASSSATVTVTVSSSGPEPAGWYSGDMHVHRSCGGTPQSVSSVFQKMSDQNLSVISLLADMGNGEVQNPITDLPLVNGQDAAISTPDQLLHWDAEWHWDTIYDQYAHQALGGHIVVLGVSQAEQIWQEYTYPILQWAHQNNGIAGFAHLEYLGSGIPTTLTCCTPFEYPVEVALGASDFISEDVYQSGGDYPLFSADAPIQAYYRLLNCGFRPGLAAGTDYPCNDGSSPGALLTYAQVAGGQLTYRNWIEAIAAGRTVVSRNGHREFLDLRVNGSATPGDEIDLQGGGTVNVSIDWTASENLSGTVELVQNGVVIASKVASVTPSSPVQWQATAVFSRSGWLAARRMGSDGHQVHTAAVFVIVGGAPIRTSADDANFYVQWIDNLLTQTSPGGAWNVFFPTSLSATQARYSAAREVFQQIANEASNLLAISTVSVSSGALNVPYSVTLAATGGTAPYAWQVSDGALPPGLALSSDGKISGVPSATGSFAFTVQVTDSGTPQQSATLPLSIDVSAGSSSLWPSTAAPAVADGGPDTPVEVGVRFRSDENGFITGIRFYKAATNTGTHTAHLWTGSGTLLASATFQGESASGWQEVDFAASVAITANTTYVASYHCNNGHYSDDTQYFTYGGVDAPPLHALPGGTQGLDGVYSYGQTSTFPNQSWDDSNYWVDVVFQTGK